MSVVRTVTVQLLDKEYAISCPDGAEAELLASADYLDGKMREIRDQSKLLGLERVAVMAALNIAHELMKKGQSNTIDTEEQLSRLATKMDAALQRSDKNQVRESLATSTQADI